MERGEGGKVERESGGRAEGGGSEEVEKKEKVAELGGVNDELLFIK